MDKAGNALRRSGVRLIGASKGHTELQLLISELKKLKATVAQLGKSKLSSSQDLLNWTTTEGNAALQEVSSYNGELSVLFQNFTADVCDVLREVRHGYESILVTETYIENFKEEITTAEAKAAKLQKDAKRSTRRGTKENPADEKVREAQGHCENLRNELKKKIKEKEKMKIKHVRNSLISRGKATRIFAKRLVILSEAQIQIAETLPENISEDLHELTYSGGSICRSVIDDANDKLSALAVQERIASELGGSFVPPPPENPDLPPRYEDLDMSSISLNGSIRGYTPVLSPSPSAPPGDLEILPEESTIGWKRSAQ
ncbi:uncharacterized protein LOC136035659 isoform X3 [Artemia franciscana]|uniref:Uncharacterized protein n=1 Tax=Artemia franciscana TaxID=6661 RepID=A0AA88I5V4_ARTSF|nr:hypothetical protein QYM36_003959 [Artemia franciscana]